MQNECYEQKNVDFFKHTQLFTKEYQDAKIKSKYLTFLNLSTF
jgi:hypothetical protein